jgi:hypothetical protein
MRAMHEDDGRSTDGVSHGFDARVDGHGMPAPHAPPRYPELVAPAPRAAPETNGLGVASFIFSILGFVLLPVVGSVVGLVLGFVAMRREPKGLAVAGTAISAIGLLLSCAGIVFFAMMVGFFTRTMQGFSVQSSTAVTLRTQQWAADATAAHFATTGEWPADLESVSGGTGVMDAWGTPMALRVNSEVSRDGGGSDAPPRATIESAGPDGVFDTEDDLSWPVVLPAPAAAAPADAAP